MKKLTFVLLTFLLTSCSQNLNKSSHIHNWNLQSTHSATCTQNGSNTYWCSCGETKIETLYAKGHTYGSNIKCAVCGQMKTGYSSLYLDNDTKKISEGTKTFYSSGTEAAAGIFSFTVSANSKKLWWNFLVWLLKL